jgi:hypothetical protein
MSLQIGDIAPDFEVDTTDVALETLMHDSNALSDLFQVVARANACSPLVLAGLLAWASLNVRKAPKRDGGHTVASSSALIHS